MPTVPSPTTIERAAIHAALSDPHRLQICDELALSDRSPSELGERLGVRSNLLAHHLTVLTHAGVIETVRSAGDGRRRYVRLRSETLARLAPPRPILRPASILFVCSANSARSPLAAALWLSRSTVPAQSAGTRPAARVHPHAIAAGERAGLDVTDVTPRALDAVHGAPGLIVTVCDEAHEELTAWGSVPRLHWSIPDPVASGNRRAFDAALAALRARMEPLRASLGLGTAA